MARRLLASWSLERPDDEAGRRFLQTRSRLDARSQSAGQQRRLLAAGGQAAALLQASSEPQVSQKAPLPLGPLGRPFRQLIRSSGQESASFQRREFLANSFRLSILQSLKTFQTLQLFAWALLAVLALLAVQLPFPLDTQEPRAKSQEPKKRESPFFAFFWRSVFLCAQLESWKVEFI